MRFWRTTLVVVWLVTVFVVAAGGIFFGAYYHNEISVWWIALRGNNTEYVATEELPVVNFEQDSYLELPNLEEPLPLVYSETLDEPQIQEDLKKGAVVLPLGTSFGQAGNVVVTAHSSGTEAFGPYRFGFAKLAELEAGQEYVVSTPEARYTYRVYGDEIVWPHQTDRLPNDERSTVTLVTCWPLWTNFQRLLVHSELVSVDYRVD